MAYQTRLSKRRLDIIKAYLWGAGCLPVDGLSIHFNTIQNGYEFMFKSGDNYKTIVVETRKPLYIAKVTEQVIKYLNEGTC